MAIEQEQWITMAPRTGKLVDSKGFIVNEADYLAGDVSSASRRGSVYRAFITLIDIAASTTVNVVLNIPSTVEVYGLTQTTTIEGASVTEQNFVAAGAGTVSTSATGYSYNEVVGSTAASTLDQVDTVTTPVARTPAITLPVGNRQQSTQTLGGFQPKFNSANIPVFQYTTGGTIATVKLELSWEEIAV